MVEALIVSNLVLWVLVVVLAAVVAALARQIGVLHERVAPAGALVANEGPQRGEAAPAIEVEDWNGAKLTIGGVQRDGVATLLLFVAPSCPVCKVILPIAPLVARSEDPALRLIVASDGVRGDHAAFVAEHGLDRGSYVLSRELGLAYQVGRLPYAVLLGASGRVEARGLVNTREHLESLFEARAQQVGSIQEFASRRVA